MYCQRCGTKIPKNGSFCPKCGSQAHNPMQKSMSQTDSPAKPADQNGTTSVTNLNASTKNKHGKAQQSKKVPAIIIVVASIAIVLVALFLFSETNDPNALRKNEPRHVPTIAEITQLSNSIEGGKLSFKKTETEVYQEAYVCLFDGKDCGDLFLQGVTEDVGIYIEKSAPSAQLAFGQLSVGAVMACDPALSIDEAKSIVDSALQDGQTTSNDVTYRTYTKSDRYIFRMDIPEGRASKND